MNNLSCMLPSVMALALGACFCLHVPDASAQSAESSGYVSFQNIRTSRCLSNDIEGKAFTEPCKSTNTYHDWTIEVKDGLIGYQIRNRVTGYCLEMFGSTVTAAVCRPIMYQRWLGLKVGSTGYYKMLNLGEYRCIYNYQDKAIGISPAGCADSSKAYQWLEAPN